MANEQIVSVIENALMRTSEKKNINLAKIRIRLEMNENQNDIVFTAMKETQDDSSLSWRDILGSKVFFKSVVKPSLLNKLRTLSEEFSIELGFFNVRIFAENPQGKAGVFVFRGNKAIKKVELNRLL